MEEMIVFMHNLHKANWVVKCMCSSFFLQAIRVINLLLSPALHVRRQQVVLLEVNNAALSPEAALAGLWGTNDLKKGDFSVFSSFFFKVIFRSGGCLGCSSEGWTLPGVVPWTTGGAELLSPSSDGSSGVLSLREAWSRLQNLLFWRANKFSSACG